MTPGSMRLLTDLVRNASGIELGPDKDYLLRARLDSVLRDSRLGDLDDLARHVGRAPAGELARRAVEAVTTNETSFFRDAPCFDHLTPAAWPTLRAARDAGTPLRVWSAACSTGQEPYSIAMAIVEARAAMPFSGASLPAATSRIDGLDLLATDISRAALDRAENGRYSTFEVSRGLSPARLRAHFTDSAEGWRVRPSIRSMVRYRRWNLLDTPAPLGRFDVVFCRNVLIYFSPELRRRVLERIAAQLAPDGYLYLGATETLLGVTDLFDEVKGERGIFARASGKARESRARPDG